MPLPLVAIPIAAAAAAGGASTGSVLVSAFALLGLGAGGSFYLYSNNSKTENSRSESLNKQTEILKKVRDEVHKELAEVHELSQEHTDSIDSVALIEHEEDSRQKIDEAEALVELRALLQVNELALKRALDNNKQLQGFLDEKVFVTQNLQEAIDDREKTIEDLNKTITEQKGTITKLEERLKRTSEQLRFFKQYCAPKNDSQSSQEQLSLSENRPAAI